MMERDAGVKFTHDSREPSDNIDEPAIYEEMPVELQPKLTQGRKFKKSSRGKKSRKRKTTFPQAKSNMK
jgi:hypothetical protein